MQARTIQQATEILVAVLERGLSYREAAAPYGLARSTAERQLKALVRLAASQRSIRAFRDADLGSLVLLRSARNDVLKAVREFDPAVVAPRPRQRSAEGEVSDALRGLRSRSGNPSRDVALLLLVLSTGAKPLEIAHLRVSDYLDEDGRQRACSPCESLSWSDGGRRRRLYFLSERLRSALDTYLEERLRRGHCASGHPSFRGLCPDSSLFLTRDGRPFQIKARSTDDERPTCPVLVSTFRQIFMRAGMSGMTTQSARRELAQRLMARGATDRQIGELLGIVHQRSVKRLLGRSAPSIEHLLGDVI